MPLPPEVLDNIKKQMDEAEERIKSVEDVISDLRASGIDASKQEEALSKAKDTQRMLSVFYKRQSERTGE